MCVFPQWGFVVCSLSWFSVSLHSLGYPGRDSVKKNPRDIIFMGDHVRRLGADLPPALAELLILWAPPPKALTLRCFPGRAMILAASPQSGWVLRMSPSDCVLVLWKVGLELVWRRLASPSCGARASLGVSGVVFLAVVLRRQL